MSDGPPDISTDTLSVDADEWGRLAAMLGDGASIHVDRAVVRFHGTRLEFTADGGRIIIREESDA